MGLSNTSRQITPNTLLPYAVALMDASQHPRPLVRSSVTALLGDLYCRPGRLAVRARHLPTTLYDRWVIPTVLYSPQQPTLPPSPWSVSLSDMGLYRPACPSPRPSSFVFASLLPGRAVLHEECLCQGLGCRKWKSRPTISGRPDHPRQVHFGSGVCTSRSLRYLYRTLTPNSRSARHSFNISS